MQRLQRLADGALRVPARLAPEADWLPQALFAIKHEGVRLDYLAAALRQVPAQALCELVKRTPNPTKPARRPHAEHQS